MVGHALADFTFVLRVFFELTQFRPAEFRFKDSEMLMMFFRFFAIQFFRHKSLPDCSLYYIASSGFGIDRQCEYPTYFGEIVT